LSRSVSAENFAGKAFAGSAQHRWGNAAPSSEPASGTTLFDVSEWRTQGQLIRRPAQSLFVSSQLLNRSLDFRATPIRGRRETSIGSPPSAVSASRRPGRKLAIVQCLLQAAQRTLAQRPVSRQAAVELSKLTVRSQP